MADLGEETTYGRVPNVNERTTAIMIIINGLRLHVPSDREPRCSRRTIPGFRSEHEAQAWGVQAERMINAEGPRLAAALRTKVVR